uniref:Uncharacterized protein n=1 Tax=Romanomermis culicivorax TaxID=13658 RepID=A0A915INN5_ROMCU
SRAVQSEATWVRPVFNVPLRAFEFCSDATDAGTGTVVPVPVVVFTVSSLLDEDNFSLSIECSL